MKYEWFCYRNRTKQEIGGKKLYKNGSNWYSYSIWFYSSYLQTIFTILLLISSLQLHHFTVKDKTFNWIVKHPHLWCLNLQGYYSDMLFLFSSSSDQRMKGSWESSQVSHRKERHLNYIINVHFTLSYCYAYLSNMQ